LDRVVEAPSCAGVKRFCSWERRLGGFVGVGGAEGVYGGAKYEFAGCVDGLVVAAVSTTSKAGVISFRRAAHFSPSTTVIPSPRRYSMPEWIFATLKWSK